MPGESYRWELMANPGPDPYLIAITFVAGAPAEPIVFDEPDAMLTIVEEGIQYGPCWGEEYLYRDLELVVSGVSGEFLVGAAVHSDAWGTSTYLSPAPGPGWIHWISELGGCFDVFVEDELGQRSDVGSTCLDAADPTGAGETGTTGGDETASTGTQETSAGGTDPNATDTSDPDGALSRFSNHHSRAAAICCAAGAAMRTTGMSHPRRRSSSRNARASTTSPRAAACCPRRISASSSSLASTGSRGSPIQTVTSAPSTKPPSSSRTMTPLMTLPTRGSTRQR